MRLRGWSRHRTGAVLVILLAVGVAACGSSSKGPSSSSSSSNPPTTQHLGSGGSGSGSVTLTGVVQGTLTHVSCPPQTANITGTINGTDYELVVGTSPGGADYALLSAQGTNGVTNKWTAEPLRSGDTFNAAGGSIDDDLPPYPPGSGSGTVHASGHWSC